MAARPRTLPVGPLLAILGAVILLVSLFLDWYDDLSAWTVFELIDLLLAALALATILLMVERLAPGALGRRTSANGGRVALPLTLAALVIVVSQIVNHPPAGIDRDPKVGLWLALAATALMALGALLASARISVELDVDRPTASEAPTVSRPERPPAPRPPSPPPPAERPPAP